MYVDFGFLAAPADAPGIRDAELYAGLLDSCAFHRDLGYRTAVADIVHNCALTTES